ncbi:hypothetical protein KFE25_012683 [Diacronema lutheri]|uniref:t-SNARE coiled-coil homology domain-containing protein n=1 Tax=Diacronema lutheri TaxID=2081491 RepID=A0A8J6C6L5_DIALT|nr:hypothetical protein KFE25_012683 [Diacronema lutheri]
MSEVRGRNVDKNRAALLENGYASHDKGAAYDTSFMERQNDEQIGLLGSKVSQLKQMTLQINDMVAYDNRMLDEMGTSFDRTGSLLGGTMRRLDDLAKTKHGRHMIYLALFVLAALAGRPARAAASSTLLGARARAGACALGERTLGEPPRRRSSAAPRLSISCVDAPLPPLPATDAAPAAALAAPTPPPPSRGPWAHVCVLVGAQLMLNLGISQVVPVLPYYATEAGGLSAAGLGVVLAMPSASRLVVNLPLGRLADSLGRKPLMVCGTLLTTAGIVGTGLAMPHGLYALVPFRLLVGVGSAASMVGSGAMVADLSDRAPEQRARIMGVQQAVISCAWAGGPAVGGWVAETYGPLASFYAAGVGTLLCSAGYACLPETSGWASILRCPDQRLLVALSAGSAISQAAFMSIVPLQLAPFGAGPASLGAVFAAISAVYMLTMPIGSALADRSADKRALAVGAMLASHVAFGSLAWATSYEGFMATLIISNAAAGLGGPAVGALMAEVTPRDIRGQALSVHRTAADALGLCAPIVLGVLADTYSCPHALFASGAAMASLVALTGSRSIAISMAAADRARRR